MKELVVRHIKVFTRDRTAFFLSFLSVGILIVMYKVFLGQFQIDAINEAMGTTTANQDVVDMVNYWLIAGLVTITSMTSTLGAYGVMISDKEKGKVLDFHLTAISNAKLQLTYVIAAVLIGTFTSFFAYLLGIILFVGGGALLSSGINTLVLVLGNIFAAALLSILMIYPICKLIKARSAFATLSTIVGTIIGFVSGIYISIGSVTPFMRTVMSYFPLTQMNAFLKKVLMKDSLNNVFSDAPDTVVNAYKQNYGIDLSFNTETILTAQQMLIYLFAFAAIALVFNITFTKVVSKVETQ